MLRRGRCSTTNIILYYYCIRNIDLKMLNEVNTVGDFWGNLYQPTATITKTTTTIIIKFNNTSTIQDFGFRYMFNP